MSAYSPPQLTRATYPVLVKLLLVLSEKGLLDNRDILALLEGAAKEVDKQAGLVDRTEAAKIIRDEIAPLFR